ncbi:MAG: hypothetical protein AAGA91_12295 [Pseudomonadota bacterium]
MSSLRTVHLLALLLWPCALFPVAHAGEQKLWVDSRSVQVDISDEFSEFATETIETWLIFLSKSLDQAYGEWPQRSWRYVVRPASAHGADPIPWAQVRRDEVNIVEFYISPDTSLEILKRSWTGYHEAAHLLIPYRGWGDTWFSEGLATYYQNLLQARMGLLDERGMWQKIHDGLVRGREDTRFDGESLWEVSAAMRQRGGFMRVYWTGVWYFLNIDVRLRRQSDGKVSLDSALRSLNDCCGNQPMSVPAMVARLDELNQLALFEPSYQRARNLTTMPDWANLFASLGITVTNGRVSLQTEGPGATLRKGISSAL